MNISSVNIIILAAGAGTRMYSGTPKLLHKIAGRSMLAHVASTAADLARDMVVPAKDGPHRIIIVHAPDQHKLFAEELTHEFDGGLSQHHAFEVMFAEQATALGTGHAIMSGLSAVQDPRPTLVLNGDQPIMPQAALQDMLQAAQEGVLAIAAFTPADPHGYGRLLQQTDGNISGIVEQKDATPEQCAINLCYAGAMVIPPAAVSLLEHIDNNNAAGEYYATDLIALAHAAGIAVRPHLFAAQDISAVNTLEQLAAAEKLWQQHKRRAMLQTGVQMLAPDTVFFSVDTQIAPGSVIEPNVFFARRVHIKGPSLIRAFSYLEDTIIGEDCILGPFCRTRPYSVLGNDVRLGNFVEIKKAHIADHTRVNHLSYLGDCKIEKNVNIGAGVITCNYNGVSKNDTVIRQNAFVGSNSSLVAPLVVAENSIIGAGSVMNEDNREGDLTLARNRQVNLSGGALRYRQREIGKK